MHGGANRAVDIDGDDAIEAALVQQTNRVGIADRSAAQPDRDRVAVMQDVDVEQRARQQGVEHDRADDGDDGAVDDRARTDDTVDLRLAFAAPLDVDVVVVPDQALRPADFLHHGVAGIDAEPALDAFELRTVADIDAGRADRDALITIDAIADLLALRAQFRGLFHREAGLTPIVLIIDVE